MTQPQQSQDETKIEVSPDWLCECGTPVYAVYGNRCPQCGNNRSFVKDWRCGCGKAVYAEVERCPVCGNPREFAKATIGKEPMPTWKETRDAERNA
jgi:RNA polymerase subunit RPABC4/transcription elongation factor Spt4